MPLATQECERCSRWVVTNVSLPQITGDKGRMEAAGGGGILRQGCTIFLGGSCLEELSPETLTYCCMLIQTVNPMA